MIHGKKKLFQLKNKIKIGTTIAVLAIVVLSVFLIPTKKIDSNIRLGVSDDSSGLIIDYMKDKDYFSGLDENHTSIDSRSIADC